MGIGFLLVLIAAPGALVGAGVGALVDAARSDGRSRVVCEALEPDQMATPSDAGPQAP